MTPIVRAYWVAALLFCFGSSLAHAQHPAPPSDFDGDGKTDIGVWRPSTGEWLVLRSGTGAGDTLRWGAGHGPFFDVPVPQDYDGDRRTDIAVWRPGTGIWYIAHTGGGVTTAAWGAGGSPFNDVPVPADYDGDGKADIAVWRPSTGTWYIVRSSGGVSTHQWGAGGGAHSDMPVPADYDGDGRADIAVWRGSTGDWYIVRSSTGTTTIQHVGLAGLRWNEVPVPGDYDGDGKMDIAVFNAGGIWYTRPSSINGAVSKAWGVGWAPYNDVPARARNLPSKVRVLYVRPQDRPMRWDYYAAVRSAVVDLQGWYKTQLNGSTFSLWSPQPEICDLPRTNDYYAVDTWTKVFNDVQACAPVGYSSPTFVWVLYVDVTHACNAPGRLGAGAPGLTMLGRTDMDGLIGARVIEDCGQEFVYPVGRYIGGLGHEVGHAFGLPHPAECEAGLPTCDWNALMFTGYINYPNTYLRADEKQKLNGSSFLRYQ